MHFLLSKCWGADPQLLIQKALLTTLTFFIFFSVMTEREDGYLRKKK